MLGEKYTFKVKDPNKKIQNGAKIITNLLCNVLVHGGPNCILDPENRK